MSLPVLVSTDAAAQMDDGTWPKRVVRTRAAWDDAPAERKEKTARDKGSFAVL